MSRLLTYGVMQQKRKIVGTGFKTEWTVSGDATARTITLPLANSGIFNCTVDWGDGSEKSIITAYNDADRIHTYASDGTYEVEIIGQCPSWSFNNGGDKLKITKIIHWGDNTKFSGFSYWFNGFWGCSNIKNDGTFYTPPWATSIPDYAFNNCRMTGNLVVTAGTSIGINSFRGNLFTSIDLSANTVEIIYQSAFFSLSTLTGTLTLPESLTRINATAFQGCNFTGSIDISNLITIEAAAFLGVKFTGNLNIPATLDSLANTAFNGNNFDSITSDNSSYPVYDNVIYDIKTSGKIKAWINANGYIGSLTFRSDTTDILTNGFPKRTGTITIPTTVTVLGASAFQGSSNLTGSIPAMPNITAIPNNCFYGCGQLNGALTIPDICTSIGEFAFRATAIQSINLGNGVQTIGALGFFGLSSVSGTLVLPASLSSIGANCFSGCSNINRVDAYKATAPTVATNGLLLGGTARPLHIPTGGGTGYNVEPWTTATIFTQPAIDDL